MTYKAGDKVRYNRVDEYPGMEGWEAEVVQPDLRQVSVFTKVRTLKSSNGENLPVGKTGMFLTTNLELIEPEFGFKDIQVGDKVRRTETWDSGTVQSVEGVVVNLSRTIATTHEGIIVGYYRDEANPHMTLELLDRPEKPKHWTEEKPVGSVGLSGKGNRKKLFVKKGDDLWFVTFLTNDTLFKLANRGIQDHWPLKEAADIEWLK